MPDPAEYEARTAAIRSPDCKGGKHLACIGDAWDVQNDIPADCTCSCHWDTLTSAPDSWGVQYDKEES